MKRRAVCALVVVLLIASVGSAQTLTELLQKGIYTQETVGDLDAAIRIYQQVIAGTQAASELRVQAQRRLRAAEAQRRLLGAAAPRANEGRTSAPREPLGTVAGRLYRHTWTGVTFEIPEGWKVLDTVPSSDNGEMALLLAADPAADVNVWLIPEKNDADSINTKLNESPRLKAKAREGLEGYRLREGSVQRVYIGGQRAMVAIADYTVDNGRRAMAEYLTWIYTENTHTFFFAHVPADQLERLRPQFEALIHSAIIP